MEYKCFSWKEPLETSLLRGTKCVGILRSVDYQNMDGGEIKSLAIAVFMIE